MALMYAQETCTGITGNAMSLHQASPFLAELLGCNAQQNSPVTNGTRESTRFGTRESLSRCVSHFVQWSLLAIKYIWG